MRDASRGVVYGVIAYTAWGLLPVYWKALKTVPAVQILCHRMVWSFLFMALLMALGRRWRWVRPAVRHPSILLPLAFTAALLAVNWFTYLWAVNAGHIVEVSLGYFINPLFNVVLGAVFLKERLRFWQGIAVSLALVAVAFLTVSYGSLPWIALTLAVTFGLYGLVRKIAHFDALEGLTVETAILFLPALGFLGFLASGGRAPCWNGAPEICMLLVGAGAVTSLPLLLFVSSAKRITLTSLGLLQYIAPTLHFTLGAFVYGEPVTATRLAAFAVIWVALTIYSIEGVANARKSSAASRWKNVENLPRSGV